MNQIITNADRKRMIGDFVIPDWWECVWRRNPCGRPECRFCGKIQRARQKHIDRGEDPDDMKCVLEDVHNNFAETAELLKKDAVQMGIDLGNLEDVNEPEPPEPHEFAIYNRLDEWHKMISDIAKDATKTESWWLGTEAAADLFWYYNTVMAKTYRLLSDRWQLEHGETDELDYVYTKYVAGEVLKILKNSLAELLMSASDQKGELMLAAARSAELESEILQI